MLRAVLLVPFLATLASASPTANRLERTARREFLAARTECRTPGDRLHALVAELFDAPAFSRSVITGWDVLTDVERATFTSLADRVVGTEQRARAIRQLCAPGTVEGAFAHDDTTVFIKLRTRDGEPCTSLIFDRTTHWRFRGEWFCGVTIPLARTWREQHGNGDFSKAIDYLRSQL